MSTALRVSAYLATRESARWGQANIIIKLQLIFFKYKLAYFIYKKKHVNYCTAGCPGVSLSILGCPGVTWGNETDCFLSVLSLY